MERIKATLSMSRGTETVVERIATDLARQILRGEVPAHSHLPPVRRLADLYGVTVSTIQRVVARLEALGMVDVRQGSGATVRDTEESGGLDLLPLMLSANEADPRRSGKLFADFLEVRRVLAVHIFGKILQKERPVAIDAISSAVWGLEEALRAEPRSLRAILRADCHISRAFLKVVDQSAVVSVLNLFEQVLASNEILLEAAFDRPERFLTVWRTIIDVLKEGGDAGERLAALDGALEGADRETVSRFVASLERRREIHEEV